MLDPVGGLMGGPSARRAGLSARVSRGAVADAFLGHTDADDAAYRIGRCCGVVSGLASGSCTYMTAPNGPP